MANTIQLPNHIKEAGETVLKSPDAKLFNMICNTLKNNNVSWQPSHLDSMYRGDSIGYGRKNTSQELQ